MKLWIKISLVLAVYCVAVDAFAEEDKMPIKDLRLPLEHYEDGRIKSQLVAALAKVPARGDIEAEDVRVELYTREGDLDTLIIADDCRYNKKDGATTSESYVRLEKPGIVITGVGLDWRVEQQIIKILDNVKVVLRPVIRKGKKADTQRQKLSGGKKEKYGKDMR